MGLQFISNPIVLAAVAVAAVGYVIYEIVSNQNRKQQHHQRGRRAHSPHYRPPPPSPPSYPKKPTTETSVKRKSSDVTSHCTPKPFESNDSTSNNIRKRTSQTESKSSDYSSKLLNLDNVDEENLDIKNYDKNVLDKIQNDVNKSYNFDKNITEDPDEPKSNVPKGDDKKSNEPVASTSTAACSTSHSSWDADSDEEMYKKDVHDVLKNDIEFSKKACDSEDMSDHVSGVQGTEFLNSFPTPSGICKACEQNRVNARAYPCNHDYLCIDCAVKMFRLLRKCNICFADIHEFRVVES